MRIRTVIVDDEPPARAVLREFLAAADDIELVAECANGFEAVRTIAELGPDLVFLDIQMPKLNGFEVLELLDPGPAIIFVTAHDEFALRAFEVNAVDYLLKPFGRERLAEALERLRARLAVHPRLPLGPTALAAQARPPGHFAERVLVKDGAQITVIPAANIDLVEAQDDYVLIHVGGRTHLKTQTLSELAASLDPAQFVRVHRSALVNVERIARIELCAKDTRVLVLQNGKEVPVSRGGYARLKERI